MNAIQKKKKKANVKLDTEVWRVKEKSLSTPPPSRAVPSADRGWSWVPFVCPFAQLPPPGSSVFTKLSHIPSRPVLSGLAGSADRATLSRHLAICTGASCAQTPETKGKWRVCILPRRGGDVYYAACALLGRMCDRVCYNSSVSRCKSPWHVARGQSLVPFHPYPRAALSWSVNLEVMDQRTGLRLALDPARWIPWRVASVLTTWFSKSFPLILWRIKNGGFVLSCFVFTLFTFQLKLLFHKARGQMFMMFL